jgi:hypothetical protein
MAIDAALKKTECISVLCTAVRHGERSLTTISCPPTLIIIVDESKLDCQYDLLVSKTMQRSHERRARDRRSVVEMCDGPVTSARKYCELDPGNAEDEERNGTNPAIVRNGTVWWYDVRGVVHERPGVMEE